MLVFNFVYNALFIFRGSVKNKIIYKDEEGEMMLCKKIPKYVIGLNFVSIFRTVELK